MIKNFLIFFSTLSFILFAYAFISETEDSTANSEIIKTIEVNPYLTTFINNYESYLDSLMRKTQTPGAAVAIIKDTSVVLIKGLGVRHIEKQIPVDQKTVFRIGSLSKGFGALMAAKLVQDSTIHWNDKVKSYLEDFKLKNAQYTDSLEIHHILSHSSGLPYHAYTNLIEDGLSLENISLRFKNVDLVAAPGKIYAYQNAAFSMIQLIAGKASETEFKELLNQEIFIPLKINTHLFTHNDFINYYNIAYPHYIGDSSAYPITISNKYYNALVAGGINLSISDMAEYMQVLLGNRPDFINGSSLDELFNPEIRSPAKRFFYRNWPNLKKAYYAKGWRIMMMDQDTVAYHGGYVNGYRSEIALSPKYKWAICVLTNAPSGFAARSISQFLNDLYEYLPHINSWEKHLAAKSKH